MSRRVSIDDHAKWRVSLGHSQEPTEDLDLDPEAETPPAQRPKRAVNRVLAILDQLDREDNTP